MKELLTTLHLVPPNVGESGEAQIGGWWATRIGALLAVIGVVFLGVYVSAHTTPLVRWLELVAIALGVTATGSWLERKTLRVGPVITGAGHALIFFTAFAGYAVDPVKVVGSPLVAAGLQALAVAYIGWAGWRRNSPTTATMSVLLGYVSAFFALAEAFYGMAAIAGLLLATAAVMLGQKRNWRVPVYCSVVLTPILTMARIISERNSLDPIYLYGLVLAGFAIHFSLAYLSIQRRGELVKNGRRFQTLNISLSLLAGLIATGGTTDGVTMAGYFAGAGVFLLGLTFWVAHKLPNDPFVNTLGVKAASLFALAAIAHFDSRTRWMALLVETVVLVAAAQRSGRNALRFAALGVWLVSLGFFAEYAMGPHLDMVSTQGLAALIYVVATIVAFDFLARQWRQTPLSSPTAEWLLGFLAAAPLWMLCANSFSQSWSIAASALFGFGLAGWMLWRRSRVVIPAGVVAFATAQLAIQFFNERLHDPMWLWAGALPLGVGTLAAGAWCAVPGKVSAFLTSAQTHALGVLFTLLGSAALLGATVQALPIVQALVVVALLAVALTSAGVRLPSASLTVGGMISLGLGAFLWVAHAPGTIDRMHGTIGLQMMALAAPLLWVIGSRHKDQTRIQPGNTLVAFISAPLVIGAIGDASVPVSALAIFGIGAVFSVIAHRYRVPVAYAAASAIGLLQLASLHNSSWIRAEGATLALAAVAVLALAIAVQPLLAQRTGTTLRNGLQRTWTLGHLIAAAWFLSVVILNAKAPWQAYGSVLWAIAGIVLFGIGVGLRARAHRIAGLIVLMLCIPRVFVHDIDETKHRIAAFIVLGLLLLWVGFSYQKFRNLIDGSPREKTEPGRNHRA
ncbi:MAG: hypothetical protein SynsKO_04540 [Synoicihabitans sp.]